MSYPPIRNCNNRQDKKSKKTSMSKMSAKNSTVKHSAAKERERVGKRHKLDNQLSASAAASTNESANGKVCNICKLSKDCADLSTNLSTVMEYCSLSRLPDWHIKQILTSICARCLQFAKTINESSSVLRDSLEQALPSNLSSTTTLSSLNSTIKNTLCEAAISSAEANTCESPANLTQKQSEQLIVDVIGSSISPLHNTQQFYAALEVNHEVPYSPKETESGPAINDYDSQKTGSCQKSEFMCEYCLRVYRLERTYKKHKRRCRLRKRQDSDGVKESKRLPRTFKCKLCEYNAATYLELKGHKQKEHMKQLMCDKCGMLFVARFMYDVHKLDCDVIQEYNPFVPLRRTTRSQSLFSSKNGQRKNPNNNNETKDKQSNFGAGESKNNGRKGILKSPNSKSSQGCRSYNSKDSEYQESIIRLPQLILYKDPYHYKRIDKQTPTNTMINDESMYCIHDTNNNTNASTYLAAEQSNTTSYAENQNHWINPSRSSYASETRTNSSSNISNYFTRNSNLYRKPSTVVTSCTESLDNEYSLNGITRRNSYTNRWIKNNAGPIGDDVVWKTKWENNTYFLERLKIEIQNQDITCFETNCNFTGYSLNDMIKHDRLDHLKEPRFICRKCKSSFTRQVFLDYHLDTEDYGRYVCYKCQVVFYKQHHLNLHLMEHSLQSMKYKCHLCNMEFLCIADRRKHCVEKQHDWRDKPYIQIDRSATITNKPKCRRKSRTLSKSSCISNNT
ncbi:uncharacterized protein [Musca autumnalis]|uniref:uncharacterized protein n=1 Tax=Musca autumnalis TaxID=221902 RepID=UPI003CED80C7